MNKLKIEVWKDMKIRKEMYNICEIEKSFGCLFMTLFCFKYFSVDLYIEIYLLNLEKIEEVIVLGEEKFTRRRKESEI